LWCGARAFRGCRYIIDHMTSLWCGRWMARAFRGWAYVSIKSTNLFPHALRALDSTYRIRGTRILLFCVHASMHGPASFCMTCFGELSYFEITCMCHINVLRVIKKLGSGLCDSCTCAWIRHVCVDPSTYVHTCAKCAKECMRANSVPFPVLSARNACAHSHSSIQPTRMVHTYEQQ